MQVKFISSGYQLSLYYVCRGRIEKKGEEKLTKGEGVERDTVEGKNQTWL